MKFFPMNVSAYLIRAYASLSLLKKKQKHFFAYLSYFLCLEKVKI